MNCPICNQNYNSSAQFCENCNFEIMIISQDASNELKEYITNRQERYKVNYSALNELKQKNKEIVEQLTTKNKEAEESKSLIKQQETEIDKFRGKVATTQDELNRLKSFENLASAKIEEIKKLEIKIGELNKKVIDTSKFKELDNLLKEVINKLSGLANELHKEYQMKYKELKK